MTKQIPIYNGERIPAYNGKSKTPIAIREAGDKDRDRYSSGIDKEEVR